MTAVDTTAAFKIAVRRCIEVGSEHAFSAGS
jgi:hypothetical protein